MTREEEIKCASKDYVNYLLDKQEYHNEDYTEDDIRQAFGKGAMFADKNPDLSSLWHDASEEPKENSAILVQWNIKGYSGYEFYYADSINWDRYVEIYGVSIWAYISDLLPKQFGNPEQLKGGEK